MKTLTLRKSPLFRVIAFTVLTAFIGMVPATPSYAQVTMVMPAAGTMVHVTKPYDPPQMVGVKVDLKDPFNFNFIMDPGAKPMAGDVEKNEFNKLIKYFLVSLAMPNKDMWVNLSPYESNRMIPEVFGQTEMGRDLLAQDYMLKQFTASLMYPEQGLGKTFWKKVYDQAQAKFGTTDIKVNTFNKVWILADHADIYQKGTTGILVDSHLKIMLEQDYMALEKNKEMFGNVAKADTGIDARAKMASEIVRQIIIPAIEKEVNTGKNFAAVRQVYNAQILATWYKNVLKNSLLGQVFADKAKVAGQKHNDPKVMNQIYNQYLKAYKKGVFNYIKEDMTPEGQVIPRKYFSGGCQAMSAEVAAEGTVVAEAAPPGRIAAIKAKVQARWNSGKMGKLQVLSVAFLVGVGAFFAAPTAVSVGGTIAAGIVGAGDALGLGHLSPMVIKNLNGIVGYVQHGATQVTGNAVYYTQELLNNLHGAAKDHANEAIAYFKYGILAFKDGTDPHFLQNHPWLQGITTHKTWLINALHQGQAQSSIISDQVANLTANGIAALEAAITVLGGALLLKTVSFFSKDKNERAAQENRVAQALTEVEAQASARIKQTIDDRLSARETVLQEAETALRGWRSNAANQENNTALDSQLVALLGDGYYGQSHIRLA
ncbi:MAG: hypothetical protein HQL13_01875, partial [Candidatus Omnitrophica bacterium]|nr:hypothetical protein [Candidatus Omnitrophota bacterium]